MTDATPETLLALLIRKHLTTCAQDLNSGRTTFEEFKSREKDDWRYALGIDGVDVINHLNPQGITSA